MVWIFIISVILVTAVIAGYTAWTKYQKNQMKQIIEEYAPDGVLTYGADDSSPPLRFADKDGTYKGVTIDLMSQLSLEMGVEIKCKPYKFSDGVKAVEKGDTDMVYTMSFATDSNAPLTGTQVMPMVFYCFAMFVVMMVSIFFKIGTKDFMELNREQHLKTFLMTGSALFAEWAKTYLRRSKGAENECNI